MFGFLNENIFVALSTILVGGVAIYLYLKGKKDHERDAARLILQEIRYAEQQIRNSGRGSRGYPLAARLLPTNSWNDNIHLFTKYLKETEIDMIGEFYSRSTYIDFLITERSRQKLNQKFEEQKIESIDNQFGSVTAGNSGNSFALGSTRGFRHIVQVPNPNEDIAVQLLTEISTQVEFIYNTPVVEKLRSIAEKKWFHLF